MEFQKTVKIQNEHTGVWEQVDYQLELDKNYLYYRAPEIKRPRISSHTLIDLCGLNTYSSPGKTILQMFGLLKRSPIDPYQTYKGGIVEVFAAKYLRKILGKEAVIESFSVSQFVNFNQFPEADPFSGVLDILVHSPQFMTVEVKSKEMREYERIAQLGQYPREQVAQGANQAILANTEQYMMLWGFLSESVSALLKTVAKEDLWIWGEDYEQAVIDLEIDESEIKFHKKIFTADERMINAYREKALRLYNDFYIHKRIDRKLFKSNDLKIIKQHLDARET